MDLKDKLNSKWNIWFHSLENPDFTITGYKKLFEIETIRDFWYAYNAIDDFTTGMFFLMRDDNLPIWESYGAITILNILVDKGEYKNKYMLLTKRLIGETIGDQSSKIIGISVSPRSKMLVIKLWLLDNRIQYHPDVIPIIKVAKSETKAKK